VLARLLPVGLHDLAGQGAGEVAVGEVVEEVVVGLLEADLEGVPVEGAQAFDGRVVVHAVRLPGGREISSMPAISPSNRYRLGDSSSDRKGA